MSILEEMIPLCRKACEGSLTQKGKLKLHALCEKAAGRPALEDHLAEAVIVLGQKLDRLAEENKRISTLIKAHDASIQRHEIDHRSDNARLDLERRVTNVVSHSHVGKKVIDHDRQIKSIVERLVSLERFRSAVRKV